MLKSLFGFTKETSAQKIISIFKELNSKDTAFKLSTHQKLIEIYDLFKVAIVVEELWMKHYFDTLHSQDKAAHVKYIDNIEKMSDEYNGKNMEVAAIATRLTALYLSCKIPNSSSIIEDGQSARIFEYYLSNGQINLNPPPKHRHLFLNDLN